MKRLETFKQLRKNIMKIFYYAGLLLFINAPFCYSQPLIIDEKYAGAPFVKDFNHDELISNCNSNENFWETFTDKERLLDKERCPIYTTTYDFHKLYDLLDKKTVIYRDGDFEMVMDRKNYVTTSNLFDYPLNDIVYEINLAIVCKQEIKSDMTIASYSYNLYRPFYLNTQYFYIDSNGHIYTLSLNKYSLYIKLLDYSDIEINKENICQDKG